MTPADEHDPERDAWLSEALRHAPDASIAPPAALSDAILREARAAPATTTTTTTATSASGMAGSAAAATGTSGAPAGAGRPAAPTQSHPVAALWAWLARPQVAAGFASVLAATLVGMMWWDRPMDDALQQAPPPPRASVPEAARIETPVPEAARESLAESKSIPAPAAPVPATPPTPGAGAGTPAERRPDATRAAPPAVDALARARPAAKEAAKGDSASRDEPPRTEPARSASPLPQPFPHAPPTAGDEPDRERRAQTAPTGAESERPSVAAPSAAPAPAPPPRRADSTLASKSAAAPTGAVPNAAMPTTAAPGRAAAPSAAPPLLRDEQQVAIEALKKERASVAQEPARALDRASRNSAGAAVGALARTPERSDAPGTESALGNLRAALRAEPQRWTWQRDAGRTRPVDAALRGWLERVDAAARGAGTGVARGDADAFSADGAATLQLLRDGRVHATVRIDADSLRIELAKDAAADRTARLTPSTAAALKAAMPPADR